MTKPIIEVCVEGVDGLLAAEAAGADRVELCASLMEGGLTPSMGMLKIAMERATIPFFPIIRPRGGDFLYSNIEFCSMLEDVAACREMGIKGVVFGCLTPDARFDELRMRALVEAAGTMSTTCHRAFDMTRDLPEAVEALVRCGVQRVLTSGRRENALAGLNNLKKTVELAAGRIKIMACGGLTAENIVHVRDFTGVQALHFAALAQMPGGMKWHNRHIGMGSADKAHEYDLTVTDGSKVAATILAARS